MKHHNNSTYIPLPPMRPPPLSSLSLSSFLSCLSFLKPPSARGWGGGLSGGASYKTSLFWNNFYTQTHILRGCTLKSIIQKVRFAEIQQLQHIHTGIASGADTNVFCLPSALALWMSAMTAFLCCSNSPSSFAFSPVSNERNAVTSTADAHILRHNSSKFFVHSHSSAFTVIVPLRKTVEFRFCPNGINFGAPPAEVVRSCLETLCNTTTRCKNHKILIIDSI